MSETSNRYLQLIETIFFKYYKKGKKEVPFVREDLETTAKELGIKLPKNLGDVVYTFRYRSKLPDTITRLAPQGSEWVIRPTGQAKYVFSLSTMPRIIPNAMLSETKIPDSTPGVIERYALNDEQGLLAKLRYNRLIDIFLGMGCYSLQSHLRTTVQGMGQIETDEIYIGLDKQGVHYIIPVQAKGGKDQLGTVQIEQDIEMCKYKFPNLTCIPIAAQFMENDLIALFSFEHSDQGIAIQCEKHYRLVESSELSDEEILTYRKRTNG
ncbi:MAG: hypothetical protein FWC50_00020 [Planctomycetaceae bacterium]|nr:hypothetical protein [Planctomycetaceae bacterium]